MAAIKHTGNGRSGDTNKAHFVFVPLMFQGHQIPATDTALLLASHGALATIVVTPAYTARVRATIHAAQKNSTMPLPVRTVELPLDCAAVGLPDGADEIDQLPPDSGTKYFDALALLRAPLERRLRSGDAPYPSCIVSDFCHPWTTALAASLRVPRLAFFSICAFTLLCQHNVERFNAYDGVTNDNELVVVPGLENKFMVSRAQAPGFFRGLPGFEKFADDVERAVVESDGIVMNSFAEMEPEYVAAYAEADEGVDSGASVPVSPEGGGCVDVAWERCRHWGRRVPPVA